MKAWKYVVCVVGLLVVLGSGNIAAAMDAPQDSPEQANATVSTGTDEDAALLPVDMLPVEVVALDDEDLDLGMLYGARVVIPEGTRYYASADGRGSGTYGVMGGRYAPMGADYYVGGFSNLDENNHPNPWRAYNPEDVPVAEDWPGKTEASWDDIWVVIYRDPKHERPLGWLSARSIVVVNGILGDGKSNEAYRNGVVVVEKDVMDDGNSKKPDDIDPELIMDALDDPSNMDPEVIDKILPDPGNAIEDRVIGGQDNQATSSSSNDPFISTREIAYAIEDYVDNGDKVALLMDASGSVSEYMSDIASYGAYVDKVNKADTIMTFAKMCVTISAEDYLITYVDSSGTNIYGALNNLQNVNEYDRIILVTDTEHNTGTWAVDDVSEFNGKIVIVCPNSLNMVDKYVIQEIERAFDTTTYLCRLNNQLDQIQVLEALWQAGGTNLSKVDR